METENQKLRERVEELSRETMLLAHTVTDLTAKLKLATSQAIGFIGAHAPGYYDTERNKPLPMESRRRYDGDGTAGDWMPIDAAEYERRKNDASFEFRQAAEVTHLAEKLAGRDASLAGLMKPVSKTTLADFGGDQANYDAWKKFQASAAPQPVDAAQAVPEGFALVPLIPTDEMCDAPDVTIGGCYSCSAQLPTWGEHAEIYKKMLAAAALAQPTDTTGDEKCTFCGAPWGRYGCTCPKPTDTTKGA